MIVIGLQLPMALQAAITNNRWPTFVTEGPLLQFFADEVRLYSFEQMRSETVTMCACCTEGSTFYSPYYTGASLPNGKVERYEPGTIDMSQAVAIGDWGVDAPICLDFRESTEDPTIVALYGRGRGWRNILPNFESLIAMLPR